MTSQSARLLLILVGVAVCLTVATSGDEAENNEVLSGQVNNLIEDAIKLNIVKKEANPEARRTRNRKGRRNNGRNAKKGNGKAKGPRRSNAKKGRNAKKGNRKVQKGPRRKKGNGKVTKGLRRKNGRNAKKGKGKGPRRNNGGGKGSKGGKKKTKKGTTGKWGRKKKKSQKGEVRQLLCDSVPEASKTISTGIISYRKYFNREKQIKRTKNDLDKLVKKSMPEKLVKYKTAADELKSLTTDGTNCPADNTAAMIKKVTESVANLTKCGTPAESLITVICNADQIPNSGDLTAKIDVCEGEYQPWIAGFKVCFEDAAPDCAGCFVPLNNNVPAISNLPPYSCQKPNTGGVDWIKDYSIAAKTALTNCKAEVTACKDAVTEALALASTCGLKTDTAAITTGGGRRRISLINQALLKSQFRKINLQ